MNDQVVFTIVKLQCTKQLIDKSKVNQSTLCLLFWKIKMVKYKYIYAPYIFIILNSDVVMGI